MLKTATTANLVISLERMDVAICVISLEAPRHEGAEGDYEWYQNLRTDFEEISELATDHFQ